MFRINFTWFIYCVSSSLLLLFLYWFYSSVSALSNILPLAFNSLFFRIKLSYTVSTESLPPVFSCFSIDFFLLWLFFQINSLCLAFNSLSIMINISYLISTVFLPLCCLPFIYWFSSSVSVLSNSVRLALNSLFVRINFACFVSIA